MATKSAAAAALKNRIVGHGEENPEQLLANPGNFRRHPGAQLDALRGSLRELGWVKTVLVNQTTGHVIDGHARIEEALRQGEPTIPVTYLDLTEGEEKLALAVLDPISSMAVQDDEALVALLADVHTGDAALTAMLGELGAKAMHPEPDSPDGFPEVDEDIKTDFCCPKCGYAWSGSQT